MVTHHFSNLKTCVKVGKPLNPLDLKLTLHGDRSKVAGGVRWQQQNSLHYSYLAGTWDSW